MRGYGWLGRRAGRVERKAQPHCSVSEPTHPGRLGGLGAAQRREWGTLRTTRSGGRAQLRAFRLVSASSSTAALPGPGVMGVMLVSYRLGLCTSRWRLLSLLLRRMPVVMVKGLELPRSNGGERSMRVAASCPTGPHPCRVPKIPVLHWRAVRRPPQHWLVLVQIEIAVRSRSWSFGNHGEVRSAKMEHVCPKHTPMD